MTESNYDPPELRIPADQIEETFDRLNAAANRLYGTRLRTSAKDPVDTQAGDLIRLYLSLPPANRLEVIDRHLARAGIETDARDKVLKQLAKCLPIAIEIAWLLLRVGTVSMQIDERQLPLLFDPNAKEPSDDHRH